MNFDDIKTNVLLLFDVIEKLNRRIKDTVNAPEANNELINAKNSVCEGMSLLLKSLKDDNKTVDADKTYKDVFKDDQIF